MRVSFIANRLNTAHGGSDFSLDLMARSLVERGHDVRVITLNTTAENRMARATPYEVTETMLGDGASRVDLARAVYGTLEDREAETDVFHVFNPPFVTMGGLYRLRGGETPVVGRLNNYTIFCTNTTKMDGDCHRNCTVADKFRHDERPLTSKVARSPTYVTRSTVEPWLINHVDRLFAISPAVRDIHAMNGLDEETVAVVPNFYDPAFESEADDAAEHDSVELVYVGRLTWTKGVDVLLDAVAGMDRTDVRLTVVGDGEMMETARERAQSASIADRVDFEGWVDHEALPAYYSRADLFVHPGRWPEPFGRTMLEAMQCGCVPVVTESGAPPWIVDDAGVTVPKDDPAALSTVLDDLAGDPDRRTTLGERARERVDRFAPERVLDTLEGQYRSVLPDDSR